MRLNNKGWSLNTLLTCIAVMLVFLLASLYYAYKLTNDFKNMNDNSAKNNTSDITDNSSNNKNSNDSNSSTNSSNANNQSNDTKINSYYIEKESDLSSATFSFISENNISIEVGETIIIKLSDLVNASYIDNIKDSSTNNNCDGYSNITLNSDGTYSVVSYLKCDSYTSEGYGA